MKKIKSIVFTVCLMFTSVTNASIMVWLTPTFQLTPNTNDDISLTLMISGLGDYSPESLGGFDLDVIFDPNVLSFTSYSLFGGLGDLDLFEAIDISDGEYTSGVIDLAEFSLLGNDELHALQPSEFALAELFFHIDNLASGKLTSLSLSINDFTNSFGESFDVIVGDDANIQVPAPSAFTLLIFAFITMLTRVNQLKAGYKNLRISHKN